MYCTLYFRSSWSLVHPQHASSALPQDCIALKPALSSRPHCLNIACAQGTWSLAVVMSLFPGLLPLVLVPSHWYLGTVCACLCVCLCVCVCVCVCLCFPVCRASGRTSGGVSCFVFVICFCRVDDTTKVPTASRSSWSLVHAQHHSYALRQDCIAVQEAFQFKTTTSDQNQQLFLP